MNIFTFDRNEDGKRRLTIDADALAEKVIGGIFNALLAASALLVAAVAFAQAWGALR